MTRDTVFTAALVAAIALGAGAVSAQGKFPRHNFEDIDADGNGAVTMEEIQAHMRASFDEADANGDGSLDRDEMLAHAAQRAERMADRMIERHDTDGDKAVSFDEMMTMRRDGSGMFNRMDTDGDGAISAEEFEAMREQMRGMRGMRGAGMMGGMGYMHDDDSSDDN